jgi:hypothetical protein
VFQLAGLACQHVCNWVESLGTTVRKVLCIGPPGGVNVVLRAPLLTYCCLFTVLAIPPSEETLLQLLLSDLPGHSIATPNRAKAQSAPRPPHRPCQSRCNSADPVGHAQQRVKCARPEPYLSRRAVGLHVCPAAKASSRPKPLTAIRGQQTHTTHTYVCRMATAPLIDMPAIGVLTIGAAQQHLRYTMRRMTHSSTEVESPATTFTSSSSSSLTPSGSFALSCHGKAAPLSAVHFPPSPW